MLATNVLSLNSDFNKTCYEKTSLTRGLGGHLSTSWAQLPNGSVAPDFTMTDIYGESHNLLLPDQGMSVILNFSAVWCGPCLAYKEEGILNDIYNAYGPNGSGDIMVLSFETEDGAGLEALYGEGAGTVGDFVTGTNYPIIDNASNLYWSSYMQPGAESGPVPLIYTVCPNRILTETGQAPLASHVTAATTSCGNAVTSPAATVNYSGDEYKCGEGSWEAKGDLTNLGSIPVTSAQFSVDFNGNVSTVNWSGNLNSGATATADLGFLRIHRQFFSGVDAAERRTPKCRHVCRNRRVNMEHRYAHCQNHP